MTQQPTPCTPPCPCTSGSRTPPWLQGLTQADLVAGPGPWLPRLLECALVYPGAALDFSLVRQCLGAVHSFFLFDGGTPREDVLQALVDGFPSWRLLGLHAFDPHAALGMLLRPSHGSEPCRPPQTREFGLWALCQKPDGGRFSLVYASLDATDSLFPHRAPAGLVIPPPDRSRHAGFEARLEALGPQRWAEPPAFVLHGNQPA